MLFAEHGFHGLTLGSLSLNGNDEFREGFGPLLPGCDPVPFGDLDALERELAARDVAASVVEPVQGKGVHLPPAGYLEGRSSSAASGTLFFCDEVQTGFGRTGRFFALEHWGLEPDMVCVAKALSGGFVPVGAVLVSRAVHERVFDSMERAVRHGSTFGGNDLAMAAGARDAAGARRASGVVEHARAAGRLLLELTAAAGRAPRGRARGARARPDVGDRVRSARRARGARAVFNASSGPAGAVRAADHGAAVP